jgi:hypothetical protein
LNSQVYEVFEFADDIVSMVRGKVDSVISEWMLASLDYAPNWSKKANLRINPNKTVALNFLGKQNT